MGFTLGVSDFSFGDLAWEPWALRRKSSKDAKNDQETPEPVPKGLN